MTWLARAATGKSDEISPALTPVAEAAFQKRHAAGHGVLQELPDLTVVYEGRDTNEKASLG